jgi:hypothetical protein
VQALPMLAEFLDEMMRESPMDKRRTKRPGWTLKDTGDTPPQAPDQGDFVWARQDLNLQPTDYEFDTAPSDDQDE